MKASANPPTEPEFVTLAVPGPGRTATRFPGMFPELVQVASLADITHCASAGEMPPAKPPATSAAKIRTVERCKVLRAPAVANLPKIAIRVPKTSKM
jgi:hypothetical protein